MRLYGNDYHCVKKLNFNPICNQLLPKHYVVIVLYFQAESVLESALNL